jgi:hypothetical protein
MSSQFFRIDEHVLEASHIRGFPRATATNQEEVLHLAIKQYTPLENTNPQPGDITIIAAHANGFPKVSLPVLYHLWRFMIFCMSNLFGLHKLLSTGPTCNFNGHFTPKGFGK